MDERGRGGARRCGSSSPLPVGDPADGRPRGRASPRRGSRPSRPMPTRDEAIDERSLVLVAEDHSVNRAVLLHQLEAIGFRADAADDGAGGARAVHVPATTPWCSPTCTCPGSTATSSPRRSVTTRPSVGLAAHADHGADRQRHARRARAVPGRRHGRLRREADDDPAARRQAAEVAAPSREWNRALDRAGAGGEGARRPERRQRASTRRCSST